MKEDKTRKHFTSYMVGGKVFTKEKIGYLTDKEAIERARVMNCREHTIHKLVAYKCPICQKWHVGRSRKVLTEKEREHYRKAYTDIEQSKKLAEMRYR